MLSEVERVLVEAAHAEDPPARLRALVAECGGAADERLTDEERAWLLAVDDDSLRITSLLVRKLRFERVVRGDPALMRSFGDDPAAFADAFRRYCRDVPPAAVFPEEEARAFRGWGRAGDPRIRRSADPHIP